MLLQYSILLFYFGILFLIGYVASKRIKDTRDFFVGGKNLGFWSVAFSARATGESSWLLIGLTGMGALIGYSAFWVLLGELLGVGISWFLVAKRFKRMSDEYDSLTIPDFLVSRLQPKTHLLRIIAAVCLSVFVVIYVSAQIDSTGKAFESFLHWDYFVGAIVGFVIVMIYSLSGGFIAVVWSDFFQGALMFIGLVVLPLAGFYFIDGDLAGGLTQIDPALTNIWGKGGFNMLNLLTIGGLLFIGLGYIGSPQIYVRFMSVKNESEISKGKWVAIAFTLFADAGAILSGMLARYLFTDAAADPIAVLNIGGEDAFIMLVNHVLPAALIGLYIAVVLSAIMSTIDSLLVMASSAVVRDFYQAVFKPDLNDAQMTRISRIVTLVISILALSIAMAVAVMIPSRTVFWFVIFGWSGIAATFCPVTLLAIFWKPYNTAGAIASMVSGFACVPFIQFVLMKSDSIGFIFSRIDVLAPSFVLSAIVGIIVTKLTRSKELPLAN